MRRSIFYTSTSISSLAGGARVGKWKCKTWNGTERNGTKYDDPRGEVQYPPPSPGARRGSATE